jgi:hypothetical protein
MQVSNVPAVHVWESCKETTNVGEHDGRTYIVRCIQNATRSGRSATHGIGRVLDENEDNAGHEVGEALIQLTLGGESI